MVKALHAEGSHDGARDRRRISAMLKDMNVTPKDVGACNKKITMLLVVMFALVVIIFGWKAEDYAHHSTEKVSMAVSCSLA